MDRLGDEDLRRAVVAYRDLLRSHREYLNRLNVYPVPDGDTGTNMALTLDSVVAELDGVSGMATTCKAIGHGSLMGARGNSGVILSQILRGLTDVFRDRDGIDGPCLAAGLGHASATAYQAVMRPVEGTILTVAKAAGEAACNRSTGSLTEILEGAAEEARAALERTPELLPVLAQAGVVDAGGAGFVLLIDALLHVVDSRPLPESPAPPERVAVQVKTETATEAVDDVSELRHEVMFLLEAPDDAVPEFKRTWSGLGDSIVVTGGDGLWNCHIHTNDIGGAIEAALDAGRPRRIKVTDLAEAVEEERWVRGHLGSIERTATGGPTREVGAVDSGEGVRTAVVAVGTGEGVARILRSLGVLAVVGGGQSMNPSTRDILDAVERVPADEVVVLPNNRNIIPVAKQVDGLTAKTVHVLDTVSVAEGFAALLGYDAEADGATNAKTMEEAAGTVVTGEVVRAVRDATTPAGSVRAGDYLGVTRDGIAVVGATVREAACALLEHLIKDHHEMVTIVEGAEASPSDTEHITTWLPQERPHVDAEVHRGDQPLPIYLLSVE